MSRTKTNRATVRRPFCYFLSTEHLAVCLPDDVTIPRVLCLSSRLLKKGTLSQFVLYSLRFQEKYEFDIKKHWKNPTLKATSSSKENNKWLQTTCLKSCWKTANWFLLKRTNIHQTSSSCPMADLICQFNVWKCYLISVPLISSAGDFIFLKIQTNHHETCVETFPRQLKRLINNQLSIKSLWFSIFWKIAAKLWLFLLSAIFLGELAPKR